ncbi:hypothetical protein STEG23_029445 [Scotinomys teguina]
MKRRLGLPAPEKILDHSTPLDTSKSLHPDPRVVLFLRQLTGFLEPLELIFQTLKAHTGQEVHRHLAHKTADRCCDSPKQNAIMNSFKMKNVVLRTVKANGNSEALKTHYGKKCEKQSSTDSIGGQQEAQ